MFYIINQCYEAYQTAYQPHSPLLQRCGSHHLLPPRHRPLDFPLIPPTILHGLPADRKEPQPHSLSLWHYRPPFNRSRLYLAQSNKRTDGQLRSGNGVDSGIPYHQSDTAL